jgi:hypothetical protein
MAYSNIQPVVGENAAKYKYYTVDIVSNTVIGEIPFEDVSYERSLKAAGAFNGKITTSQETDRLDLYNATMPGKTALYVVRNDECVWGGIIWGRTYDMVGRSLSVSGSEFTSYLSRRLIWKTNTRSFTANLTGDTKSPGIFKVDLVSGVLREPLELFDSEGVANTVYVTMSDSALYGFNGYRQVIGTSTSGVQFNPSKTSFYVRIPGLAVPKNSNSAYYEISVTTKADTYEYIRSLITEAFTDFVDIDFANEIIEPGVKLAVGITTKKLDTTDSSNGIATFTTEADHNLIVGQRVYVTNVDTILDGEHSVSEVPSKRSFKVTLKNPLSHYDRKTVLTLADIPTTEVVAAKSLVKSREKIFNMSRAIKRISRVAGVVTLTLEKPHTYVKAQKISVTIPKKTPWQKTIDGKVVDMFDYQPTEGFTVTGVDLARNTVTYRELNVKYNDSQYDITANVPADDKAKTYTRMATPETQLRLEPTRELGFVAGDSVRISGVDDLEWPRPIYNGNVTISETSVGIPSPISHYQLTNSLEDDYGILTLYFYNPLNEYDATGVRLIEIDADVLINGLDPRFDNQLWRVSDGSRIRPDFSSDYWSIECIVPYLSTNTSRLSAPEGAKVTVGGNKWVQYYPIYSESRGTIPEPDAVNGIAAVKYAPPGKSVYGKLTIWTATTHKYSIGDTISIEFSDAASKTAFNGVRTVIAVGADADGNSDSVSFNYVPTADNRPQAIKTRTTKAGTLTRKKAVLVPPKIESAQIKDIKTDVGGLATVVTEGIHPFVEGDYVVLSTPSPSYKSFTNNGEPVKVVNVVDDNTFQYITTGRAEASKVGNILSLNSTVDGGNLMTITTGGVGEQIIPSRTLSITNLRNDATAFSTISITANTAHQALPGEVVTLSNLPAATYGPAANIASQTSTIQSIYSSYDGYLGADGKWVNGGYLTINVTAHLWNRADIDKYPNITIQGLSTSNHFTYDDQQTYPAIERRSQYLRVLTAQAVKASRTSNVVTVTTSSAHGFIQGDTVTVTGSSTSIFGGTHTITSVPSPTSLRYTNNGANRALGPFGGTLEVQRLSDIKMNLSVYNGTYKVIDVPSSSQIVVAAVMRSNTFRNWRVVDGDVASGTITLPGVTGVAPQLTPNYALLNGVTTVYDIFGASFPAKFWIKSGEVETNKEIFDNVTPPAGTITFSGKRETIANSTPHGLVAGDSVILSGLEGYYDSNLGSYLPLEIANGQHSVISVTDTTFTIKSPLSKSVNGYQTYAITKQFAMDEFTSGVVTRAIDVTGMLAYRDYRRNSPANVKRITSITRKSDGSGVVVTSPSHGLDNGDFVYINAYGSTGGVFNQGNTPISIYDKTVDTFSYDLYPSLNIDRVSVSKNKATLYVAYGEPHKFFIGDTVTLSNFPSGVYGSAFNGNNFTITNVVDGRIVINTVGLADRLKPITLATYGQLEFASGGIASVSASSGSIIVAPTISKDPVVYTRSYGEFPDNADLGGIEFSTDNYSTFKQATQPIRGSQLVNLGGHLEQYSSSINGFDYRIDCELDYNAVSGTSRFKRIFTLVPILPKTYTEYLKDLNYYRQDPLSLDVALSLAPGQVADPSAFGADKIVFEYPGNISNVSMSENSESGATRVFIVGSNGNTAEGGNSYSAASATDLLAAGWPLLDRAENQEWPLLTAGGAINVDNWGNYDVEIDLHKTAKRFLSESKPPIGDFVITVNGSLNPIVGSFYPGDWCSLNINDAFVRSRLASPLELRKNVIVRKIDSITVNVPNNPAFPEQVDLTLVTDWQVDKVGE